jgi:hypothetical protein
VLVSVLTLVILSHGTGGDSHRCEKGSG